MQRATVLQLKDIPKFDCMQAMAARYPSLDPLSLEASLTLLCVGGELQSAFLAHLTRHDLSPGRFYLLIQLARSAPSGLSPAELSERAGVTRATITGLLDGLEQGGLVVRTEHESDRRMWTVRLTPKGQERLDAMLPDHYRRITALMSQLEPEERHTLIRLLRKVSDGIPAIRDP